MIDKFEIYRGRIRAFWMTDETWELVKGEADRVFNHAPDCYSPYKCQSCGCDRQGRWGNPTRCVSHK